MAEWFANVGQDVAKAASEVGQSVSGQNVDNRIAATVDQSKQMAGQGQAMLAAAHGGQFSITPEAGQVLIKSYQQSIQDLDEMRPHLDMVSQAPKLGETPGAKVIAPFTQGVASGGHDGPGFAKVIANLRATFQQMEQAVRQAMQNYQQADQQAADGIKKAANGL